MIEPIEITLNEPFKVGEWHVDPSTGRIQLQNSEVRLEPKVMTVLVCLAQEAGKVVSREQLEATAWAGTVVGYDSLASTIIKLRKAFADDSKNPRVIETVPKRGYRLIAAVKPALTEKANTAPEPVEPGTTLPKTGKRPLMIAVFAMLVIVVFLVWTFAGPNLSDPDPNHRTATDKPGIAVLPFKNISNDPEQDYFSDGMTADLITDLSKISGLSVIARNSVFTYKNNPADVRKVGEELNVRYVIEGSVRKANNTLRISARLIDTRSGFNLWADRFDGSLENIFVLQGEVAAKIISSLEVTLTEQERVQIARKYTASIEAYDHFLYGWRDLWEFSKDGNRDAREHFLKAIELDADFARAYANLAITYVYDFMHGWSQTAEQSLEQANLYARKAIEIDDSLPQVHWAMGLTEIFNRNYQKALLAAEKAISLDPNFADAYGELATILNYAARPEEALTMMQKAMELNPLHPFIYKVIRGEIYFSLHDYEKAIGDFTDALERNPEAQEARLWLAAALGHTGRIADAKWELDQVRVSGANLSLDYIEKVIPFKDPTQRKHLVDGLYKAGLVSE
jgi:TolB-like protein/DNA-binding winged helix-turn-helix (wHTH) protein/Flp pilus assembly protein TadD